MFAGEPNQNGNEDCAAMDPQNEGFGVGDIFRCPRWDMTIITLNNFLNGLICTMIGCGGFRRVYGSGEGGAKNYFDDELFPQWMDLDCSQENHGVPHYTVCEKIVQA